MKKWQLVGSTTVLGTALLLGACGGAAENSDSKSEDKGTDTAAKDIKGEVNGDGSTTVAPVVEKINEQFATEYPDVTV
ncbi:MAG: thioredoxine reductase, partial [Macrococcoides caseolyticum]